MRIVRGNCVPFNFLNKSDIPFCDLHQTLDRVCCDLHRSMAGLHAYECTTLDQERAVTKSLGSVNPTYCLPDENYPTESKPKLHLCNKQKSSDFPMFTAQMENCVFNFY